VLQLPHPDCILLKKTEAAHALRLSQRQIEREVNAGRLIPVRVGRAIRFRPEDLRAFAVSCRDDIDF
jgi:excisionase family DNA binding protein